MAVSLTPAAARHVNKYLSKRGKGLGVRLGVKTTGCSGLAYKLEYVDDVTPEDIVFEAMGVKILIDPKSLAYIDGTELDFVREGLNEGFKFNNPNERDRCGCGESLDAASTPAAIDELHAEVKAYRKALFLECERCIDELADFQQAATSVRSLMFVDRFIQAILLQSDRLESA